MFLATLFWTWARDVVNAMVVCLITRPAAALFTTAKLRLYTAGPTLTPDMAIGDFTEATFTGYAAVTITLSATAVNLSGNVQGLIGNALFSLTTAPGQTILGAYLTDTTGAILYGAERFNVPVPLASPGDFISYELACMANCLVAQ